MPTVKRDTYTPDSLLSVAVRVFNERGYDGTSMEHLSKAAGISKSSIYHHVRGKEELLRRGISRALDGLFAVLEEPRACEGRAVERLEHVTRRTVEVLMAELPYVTLLLRVRGNTETEVWAMSRRREFDQRVAELVKQAAAEGDLRSDVDARLATRLLFGMINSIAEWYRPDRAPHNGDRGEAITSGGAEPDNGAGTSAEVAEAVIRTAFAGLRTG
ncbi:TetR family transcriptional regulator [Streptomyces oryzae]|uniref:TetR family transcriptional regulator n=1 Tax=Streptomyces oryzae TaxID=1434886 RepID=A0ABS3XBK4_9ACTN|nr:TetR/AcrR family transcriptional regulator [Streptomyces oryzae]MBO8192767.1 TetR family transcriptional regulator [Streptomyces oryzae]